MKTLDQKQETGTDSSSGVILELRNVTKFYGDLRVLDDVSFQLRTGETKIILGGSGSGKSTLLKLMIGLELPDAGTVLIEGQDITHMKERALCRIRPKIGMVFQESGLFDSLSVFDNVAYRLYELNIDDDEIEERVRRVLSFVGLEEAIDRMPSELSGGMKRRVALARTLVSEPKIMLYDEPTAGLDPVTSRRINELIIRLRDMQGVSGVFVTHRLRDAFTVAAEYALESDDGVHFKREDGTFCLAHTRFVMLNMGKIIFEGADELLRESTEPYIQNFLS
jgi:phospholipid/cholesterol/gamma-HCH transport system ATP-binding protein